tara:strand:- start:1993 stop:2097 length:105 start_codon:yes stop_codon:yes gene_type:complete
LAIDVGELSIALLELLLLFIKQAALLTRLAVSIQ